MGRTGRWILIAVVGLLAALAVGVAVLHTAVNRWLASDEFRVWASREVSEALGVEGQFLPPRWSQATVYSDGFYGRGVPGGGLSSARADQVRAQFDPRGIFEGVWRLDSLTAGRIRIDLGDGGAGPDATGAGAIPSAAPGSAAAPAAGVSGATRVRKGGGGWKLPVPWLPRRFEMRRVRVDEFDLRWPAGGGKQGSITGTVVEARPSGAAWEFHGKGGTLRHPGAPEMAIGEFRVRLDWPALYVTSADLKLKDGGSGGVSLSGEAVFAGQQPIDLDVRVDGLPIGRFLEGDWRARLDGRLHGRARFRGPTRGEGGLTADGEIRITEGKVEALPVLNEIATLTGTKEFRSIKLDRATSKVRWAGDRLALEDLWVESQGLLKINGAVADSRGQIEGMLEVGTTEGRLRLIPGARRHVFTREADGYVWAQPGVRISGMRERVTEDLTPRLASGAVREVQENVGGAVRTVIDVIDSLLR